MQNAEILIVRNTDVPRLFDVVLADFEGENSKYLEKQISFDQAVDIRKEYGIIHSIATEIGE